MIVHPKSHRFARCIEMGGACSAYSAEERRVQGFDVETCRKETTWETQS